MTKANLLSQGEDWLNARCSSVNEINDENEYYLIRSLEKIKEGTYGKCDSCGKPIGYFSLLARPHVIFCSRCEKNEC